METKKLLIEVAEKGNGEYTMEIKNPYGFERHKRKQMLIWLAKNIREIMISDVLHGFTGEELTDVLNNLNNK